MTTTTPAVSGLDAPVPLQHDASGGISGVREHVEAMDLDITSEGEHPQDDAMRTPPYNLANATFKGCGTRSAKVPAHEAVVRHPLLGLAF